MGSSFRKSAEISQRLVPKFREDGKLDIRMDYEEEDAPLIVPDPPKVLQRKLRKDMKNAKIKKFMNELSTDLHEWDDSITKMMEEREDIADFYKANKLNNDSVEVLDEKNTLKNSFLTGKKINNTFE